MYKAEGTDVPVLDYAALEDRLGGDTELIAELAVMLAEDAPRLARGCAAAVVSGDAQMTQHLAHTLKGAAANLCAARVVATAAHLERTARAAEPRELQGLVEVLGCEVDQLLPVLTALANSAGEHS